MAFLLESSTITSRITQEMQSYRDSEALDMEQVGKLPALLLQALHFPGGPQLIVHPLYLTDPSVLPRYIIYYLLGSRGRRPRSTESKEQQMKEAWPLHSRIWMLREKE